MMGMKKKGLWITVNTLLWVVLSFGIADTNSWAAEKFPARPITMIGAFTAGGSTDVYLRTIQPLMEKILGVPTIVKAVPGAGGQIGFTEIAKSKPDGYTIGVTNIPHLNLCYSTRKKVEYHPVKSFASLGCNIVDPGTIIVHPDSPWKTLQDLIDHIRKNPGRVIIGADGPNTDDHLAVLKFKKKFNLDFQFVPYEGMAKAIAAFLGKHMHVYFGNVSEYVWNKDKTKVLAQMWHNRYHLIPQFPTVKEATGVEIINASTRGMQGPAGIPEDRLKILRDAFYKVSHDPEFVAKAEKIPLTTAWMTPEEFQKLVADVQEDVQEMLQYFK